MNLPQMSDVREVLGIVLRAIPAIVAQANLEVEAAWQEDPEVALTASPASADSAIPAIVEPTSPETAVPEVPVIDVITYPETAVTEGHGTDEQAYLLKCAASFPVTVSQACPAEYIACILPWTNTHQQGETHSGPD